jgi:integrase
MAKQKTDGQQGGGPGTRGYGGLFHDRYRDRHDVVKEVATWSIRYWANGKQRTESAHTTDRRAAEKLLQIKLGAVKDNKWTPPQANKTTFDELVQLLVDDYKANGLRSLDRLEDSLTHLRLAFTEQKALTIETDRITAYISQRRASGAANGTINRELAALKRMFRLGLRAKKVLALPYIPMLKEANTRKGFFEADQLQALLRHLPDHLRGVIQTAAITGWRIKSELATRQWQHVDFGAGWLRLEPGEAKTDEGRMFPPHPGAPTSPGGAARVHGGHPKGTTADRAVGVPPGREAPETFPSLLAHGVQTSRASR